MTFWLRGCDQKLSLSRQPCGHYSYEHKNAAGFNKSLMASPQREADLTASEKSFIPMKVPPDLESVFQLSVEAGLISVLEQAENIIAHLVAGILLYSKCFDCKEVFPNHLLASSAYI